MPPPRCSTVASGPRYACHQQASSASPPTSSVKQVSAISTRYASMAMAATLCQKPSPNSGSPTMTTCPRYPPPPLTARSISTHTDQFLGAKRCPPSAPATPTPTTDITSSPRATRKGLRPLRRLYALRYHPAMTYTTTFTKLTTSPG